MIIGWLKGKKASKIGVQTYELRLIFAYFLNTESVASSDKKLMLVEAFSIVI